MHVLPCQITVFIIYLFIYYLAGGSIAWHSVLHFVKSIFSLTPSCGCREETRVLRIVWQVLYQRSSLSTQILFIRHLSNPGRWTKRFTWSVIFTPELCKPNISSILWWWNELKELKERRQSLRTVGLTISRSLTFDMVQTKLVLEWTICVNTFIKSLKLKLCRSMPQRLPFCFATNIIN